MRARSSRPSIFDLATSLGALHLKRLTHLLCEHSNNRLGGERAAKLRSAARKSLAAEYDDEALASSVRLIIAQIEFVQAQLAQLDAEIALRFDALDHPIKTIPGIGRVTAPVILAEIGDINRFVGPRGAHRILALPASIPGCVRAAFGTAGRR